jgi:hypothetical protein
MNMRKDSGAAAEDFFGEYQNGPGAIGDVIRVERLVRQAAQDGCALSYSEILGLLGFRFSRPKMRALCKTLDEVDRRAAAAGEPELAVLVVRESDKLPGQGWWTGRTDYAGPWEGAQARAHINAVQARAFAYWQARPIA